MRLNFRADFLCLGSVEINALSRVTELDSGLVVGLGTYEHLDDGSTTACYSHESLQMIERQLAIIVPCMNEEVLILQGALRSIPHHCLIILVSNSTSDGFKAERAMLDHFCASTQRRAIIVHQADPGLASVFSAAGMPHIIDHGAGLKSRNSAGRVRSGKGEAMMIGTVLAKLNGKQFVGFIDADNFVPGAVHEYCKVFAAGLYHALNSPPLGPHCNNNTAEEQPLAMVRIKWKSKPKIVDGKLVTQESGRCSRIVNTWMNRLLTSITGHDGHADFIKTANAGEHALSTDLALQLNFATGYAVEPYQLINMWERSGVFPPTHPGTPPGSGVTNLRPAPPAALKLKVRILQIETLNPHIHDFGKGEEHIARMQAQGLSTIYHSQLVSQKVKKELHGYMKEVLGVITGENGVPEDARVYPPMGGVDFKAFEELRQCYTSMSTA